MKKIILHLLLISSFNVFAYDEKFMTMARGAGNKSCGLMTEEVKNVENANIIYTEYIFGYTNGVNTSIKGKADYLNATDGIALYKFVLKYCEDNPTDNVNKAISQMYLKLNGSYPWLKK
jgi:hypothetical protein